MSEENKDTNSILENIRKTLSKDRPRSGNDVLSFLKNNNTLFKTFSKNYDLKQQNTNIELKSISKNIELISSGKSKLFNDNFLKILDTFYTKKEKKDKLYTDLSKNNEKKTVKTDLSEKSKESIKKSEQNTQKPVKFEPKEQQKNVKSTEFVDSFIFASRNLSKSIVSLRDVVSNLRKTPSSKQLAGTNVSITPLEKVEVVQENHWKVLNQDVKVIKISLLSLLAAFKTDRLSETEVRRESKEKSIQKSVQPMVLPSSKKEKDDSSLGIISGIATALIGGLKGLGTLISTSLKDTLGGLGSIIQSTLSGVMGLLGGGLTGILRGVAGIISSGALLGMVPALLAGLGLAGIVFMAKKAYDMWEETQKLNKQSIAEYSRQISKVEEQNTKNENNINLSDDTKELYKLENTSLIENSKLEKEKLEGSPRTQKIKDLKDQLDNHYRTAGYQDRESFLKKEKQLKRQIEDAETELESDAVRARNRVILEKNKDLISNDFVSPDRFKPSGFQNQMMGSKIIEKSELNSQLKENTILKNNTAPIVISNAPVNNISTSTQETNTILPSNFRSPTYDQPYKWGGSERKKARRNPGLFLRTHRPSLLLTHSIYFRHLVLHRFLP